MEFIGIHPDDASGFVDALRTRLQQEAQGDGPLSGGATFSLGSWRAE
ncbi:MAG TPA: hypothetical protein VFW47_12075 [Phenylobacterium sp.]|nr:hypothetical protein [Phenylobacterium sp.]